MAEPRKVAFVTLTSFNTSTPATPEVSKKRRREDEAMTLGRDGDGSAVGSEGGRGLFGTAQGDAAEPEEAKPTVRLNLSLSEPSERGSAEFNYSELVVPTAPRHSQVQLAAPSIVPKGLEPSLDPNDPLANDERERREVEELAKKFENKYGGASKKKKKDRMQDLIDIGYGYDETDPFIDNSEAYDELVPASLTTKHGGFYINTGTLQFRAASDSEGDDMDNNHIKMKDGEERVIKKRRKKQDGPVLEEKKPRKNKVPKPGVSSLNRPEKKKRKKLMKDSLHLANMLRRFTREKEEMRKRNMAGAGLPRPQPKVPAANSTVVNNQPKAPGGNDCNMADLTSDPAVMSLLGSANNDVLQDMMGDLDFGMLDSSQPSSPTQGENGSFGTGHKAGVGRMSQGNVMSPPSLPTGLPGPLIKRIEDLRAASRQFDEEGRKKFFTMDMNNILLDIDLQVQEQSADVRSAVYSHLEAFVPCNKEGLLKRLKKLSLNIQDNRLRTPLLKLKLAVCSVMPEQIARYNMDCIAKVAKQQSEEGEKNGSEDDDEEKPGKRVMGPRKKFVWDDKLRSLLCNLVRVKLSCYELEGKNISPEEYLKAFIETEVKPLWPKGWMQGRMLFKESIMAHGHLTGYTAKKKIITTPKVKPKEAAWVQRTTPSAGVTPSPVGQVAKRPSQPPSEPICLDSLDDDLAVPSLDSISQALMILGNAAKGLAQDDSPSSPDIPKSVANPPSSPHVSALIQQQQKKNSVSTSGSSNTRYTFTSSSPSPPLSRPSSGAFSPVSSVRVDAMGVVKGPGQIHRHSVLNTQRPVGVAVPKVNSPASASPAKPRPPPTASPVAPPGSKVGISAPPSGLIKCSINKGVNSGDPVIITSSSRPTAHPSPAHMSPKTFLAPRLPLTPQSKASPAPPSHLGVQTTQQSGFITPMHATLTQSSHCGITPIVKLTPRTLNSVVTTSPLTLSSTVTTSSRTLNSAVTASSRTLNSAVTASSRTLNSAVTASSRTLNSAVTASSRTLNSAVTTPSRSLNSVIPTPSRTLNSVVTTSSSPTPSQIPRSQVTPPMQQFSPKSPAGFRPPFSGVSVGSTKVGPSGYAPPGNQRSPVVISSSTANSSLINTSSITKHSGTGTTPTAPTANPGQRQRPGGLTSQGVKPVTSVPLSSASSHLPQASSGGGSGLLGSTQSLPLGFGMLGGLVPVSLPFQFPPLLNLPPLGTASSNTPPSSSPASSNASFSTLTQNLYKSLQSGSQVALPPHLQLAFSDVGQSQGGDAKRKTL
ncbi:ubinuclein-2b isoform X1 [Phyllopteryx taeniolatus]|uniref:ubinuclein-2b isoform X1 n=1 Tax=Phyllopteryx taeniolatus TaxID=161469 RepID=UPI002AD4AD97|nr:ubinuclein-2b isoform X1 [Phyllopteryx taeniolatus]